MTGATGFIGAPLLQLARREGWEVVALVLPGEVPDRGPTGVHWIQGTLATIETWGAQVGRLEPQACLHLAWNTSPGEYLTTPENLDWLSWSAQLVRQAPRWGCRQVVGVGTCAEYENSGERLSESAPTRPDTLYAACKAALRLVGRELAAQARVPFTWARIFHPYGPGEHPRRLVASCIRTLLRGERFEASQGTQARDFIHVHDVAAALLRIVEQGTGGDVNVCSGEPVEIRTLLQEIAEVLGRRELLALGALPLRPWDPASIVGSNGVLRSLGWRPRFSLAAGIADTVSWWRDHLQGTAAREPVSSKESDQ
jgi:nucleoside-diphosphate-sugar epimerase